MCAQIQFDNSIMQMPPNDLYNTISKANAEAHEITKAINTLESFKNKRILGLGYFMALVWIGCFIPLLIISFVLYKFYPFTEAFSGIVSIFLATIVMIVCDKKKRRNQIEKHTLAVSSLQESTDKEISRYTDKILLIPPQYRYSLALETMLELIQSGRADSWEKCADKYEEQYHRWVMEQNSQESLELQKQTLAAVKSAKAYAGAAAVFSGIAAVTGVATLSHIKR
ncbi:MAG: hypothetical protein LBC82_07890 [Oscillospiraceae bacterium]|jgi:hypothetical protein|nr:hypothetical protein [Oscillospiraceae bacterium]